MKYMDVSRAVKTTSIIKKGRLIEQKKKKKKLNLYKSFIK